MCASTGPNTQHKHGSYPMSISSDEQPEHQAPDRDQRHGRATTRQIVSDACSCEPLRKSQNPLQNCVHENGLCRTRPVGDTYHYQRTSEATGQSGGGSEHMADGSQQLIAHHLCQHRRRRARASRDPHARGSNPCSAVIGWSSV